MNPLPAIPTMSDSRGCPIPSLTASQNSLIRNEIPHVSDSTDSPFRIPSPILPTSAPTQYPFPPPMAPLSTPYNSSIPPQMEPLSTPYNSPISHAFLYMPAFSNDGNGSTTKRKRRTAEDAAEERTKREAKRAAKEKERKEKEEETRRKQAENVVRLELSRKAKVEKAPRFKWTTTSTEELVQLVSQLKFEHDSVLDANPGFISWAKFFKENSDRKSVFDTLKDVPFDTLERRYKAICTSYKAIRDVCAETGGAGMLTQLAKYNMSQSVYDAIWELHRDNDAMNAVGGADISDINEVNSAPMSPYMTASNCNLPCSDNEGGEETPLSKSCSQGTQKPPKVQNKIARNKVKSKGSSVDEGMAALMRMQVESQERMEKWSLKLEAQREKAREDREARRAEQEARLEKEREEDRRDRAQERQSTQMMNAMMMSMLAKISGMDMSQFNNQAK